MTYIKRNIENLLKKAAKQFPAVIITGPRQAGKSTLVRTVFKNYKYITLDDIIIKNMANQDPRMLLNNYPPPLIIDEIQYAPELLHTIKLYIDQNREKTGLFIITGSQQFNLMQGVTESLAGRTAVLTLTPFSIEEKKNIRKIDSSSLFKELIIGGYPEINIKRKTDIRLWFSGYLRTYIERDIRNLKQIADLAAFENFIQILVSRNASILNMTNLSKEIGVALNTIKNWLNILQTSNQIFLLQPYYRNMGKRLIKSPKLYFLDTGLFCYLSGIETINTVTQSQFAGNIFETFVITEAYKKLSSQGERTNLYYWRTAHGDEVDLIIERKNKILPVEIKLTQTPSVNMTKSIIKFNEFMGKTENEGKILCPIDKMIPLTDKISACSIFDLLKKLE